jgi:hypothetical protein
VPYVSLPLLNLAVEGLQGAHPISVVVLPAMTSAGCRTTSGGGPAPYGSANENELFETYFRIPGGPVVTPYNAIWAGPDAWRDDRYAGRALQRQRTDRFKSGKVFVQDKTTTPDSWGFTDTWQEELMAADPEAGVKAIDLAIWYGRGENVTSLPELLSWFEQTFDLASVPGLLGGVYATDIPAEYVSQSLAPEPLDQDDLASIFPIAAPAAMYQGSVDLLVTHVEDALEASGFLLAEGLVRRVLSAWIQGDIVVLVGAGGTGKTYFSDQIGSALHAALPDLKNIRVSIRPGYDFSDLIGYERLDGEPVVREFAATVLQTDDPLAPHLIRLEEFNLTRVEDYLSEVLAAVEEARRVVSVPGVGDTLLPQDAWFLATCNSFRDEPETRFRLSSPSKRRATIITMPNVLVDEWTTSADPDLFIAETAVGLVAQERVAAEQRLQGGVGSVMDELRVATLSSVLAPASWSEAARDLLAGVVKSIFSTSHGRTYLTLGLLKDLAMKLALAKRNPEAETAALVDAVLDKVLHQMQGPKEDLDLLLAVLPNDQRLADAAARMKGGPGPELLPLV